MPQNEPILAPFDALLRAAPTKTIVSGEGRRASASDLDALARAAAGARTLAPPRGTLVAMAAPDGPGFLAALLALLRLGCPAVLLDNDYDSALTAHIGSDNELGMEAAVSHLAALGHRRIGFLGGEQESCVTAERMAGFERAARRLGVTWLAAYASFYRDFDPALVLRLVEGGCTGLVCGSDLIALMSESLLSSPNNRGVVALPLADARLRRQIGVLTRRDARLPPLAERFIEILRELPA